MRHITSALVYTIIRVLRRKRPITTWQPYIGDVTIILQHSRTHINTRAARELIIQAIAVLRLVCHYPNNLQRRLITRASTRA